MRSLFVLTTIMTQLFLVNVSFAQSESYDDCRTSCAADKATRDADCPSPYDSSQDRDQCLKTSQETYNTCIKSCPQPSPPPESSPSSMNY